MTSQEKEINSGGSGYGLVGSGVKGVNVNGFAVAAESGLGDESSVGSSGDDLRTHTRRKRVKVVKDDGKVTWCSTSQVTNKAYSGSTEASDTGSTTMPVGHDTKFYKATGRLSKGRMHGLGSRASTRSTHTIPSSRRLITKQDLEEAVSRAMSPLHEQFSQVQQQFQELNQQVHQLQEQIALFTQKFLQLPLPSPCDGTQGDQRSSK